MAEKMDLFKHCKIDKTDEICIHLNERLPVKLSTVDVEKNPEFVKLLFSLSQAVEPDGTSVQQSQEVASAKKLLVQRKQRWLQNVILYNELQELLLDQQLESSADSRLSAQSQFYRTVADALTSAEIGDYLHCSRDPGCTQTLFGIDREEFERNNPHKKHIPSIQQKLIPELEQRLQKRCETLVTFHHSSSEIGAGDSVQFALAKAAQLPAMLLEEKKSLQDEKTQLRKDKTKRLYQFAQYHKAIVESLELMEELLAKYRLKLRPENNKVTSEWLMARCDALCLKIRVLELQLMSDTYHTDAVRALNTIRMELNLSTNETQLELSHVSKALKTYESVGMGFDATVEEFTRLRDEIENKKWALHELKKHYIMKELQS